MNTKMIIATLVGGVVSFFLGWLVFSILLGPYYESHMVHYEGLMRGADTRLWAIALAQFCWAGLLAYIFDRWANIRSFGSGFMGGFITFFLSVAGYALMQWAQMNIAPWKMYAVDVLVNAVFGGIVGGVIGWMLGRGKKA